MYETEGGYSKNTPGGLFGALSAYEHSRRQSVILSCEFSETPKERPHMINSTKQKRLDRGKNQKHCSSRANLKRRSDLFRRQKLYVVFSFE